MEDITIYKPITCKHCKTENPEGAKFCMDCGRKLPKPVNEAEHPFIKEVDPVLKPAEAAKLLKISRWKLDELRIQRKLSRDCFFIIPGGGQKQIIRYRAKELLNWLAKVDGQITTAG